MESVAGSLIHKKIHSKKKEQGANLHREMKTLRVAEILEDRMEKGIFLFAQESENRKIYKYFLVVRMSERFRNHLGLTWKFFAGYSV